MHLANRIHGIQYELSLPFLLVCPRCSLTFHCIHPTPWSVVSVTFDCRLFPKQQQQQHQSQYCFLAGVVDAVGLGQICIAVLEHGGIVTVVLECVVAVSLECVVALECVGVVVLECVGMCMFWKLLFCMLF